MERSAGQALLDLLSDRPIAYHPQLARAFDSVPAAVFLGQLLYWTGRQADPEGWIWKSREEWQEETALTRLEIARARAVLRGAGVLEEKQQAGYDRTMGYRVDRARLLQALCITPEDGGGIPGEDEDPPICRNPADASAGIRQMHRPESGTCIGRNPADHDHRVPESTAKSTREGRRGRARAGRAPPSRVQRAQQMSRRRRREMEELCRALGEVTAMDPGVPRAREELEKSAAGLYSAGRRSEHVRRFFWWWGRHDWRGKKGERPSLRQVEEMIALPEAAPPPAAGRAGLIDPQDPEYQRGGRYGRLFEARCESPRPGPIRDLCLLPAGHEGPHQGAGEATWTDEEEDHEPDGVEGIPGVVRGKPAAAGDERGAAGDGARAPGAGNGPCSS